ncbi:hypothetical protein [Dickeya chrysanthemi]|uniref:Uncharacterized protein n=1 Tax=Dickeya chrysanthemi TaxID=556 RepID=A0ABU8JNB8_DICCH
MSKTLHVSRGGRKWYGWKMRKPTGVSLFFCHNPGWLGNGKKV